MKLVFTGDVFLSTDNVPVLSTSLNELFAGADAVCLNVEAPIDAAALPAARKMGPSILQSRSVVGLIQMCHATHVNLANNHIMDFGAEGLHQTTQVLGDYTCFGAGADFDSAYNPVYINAQGVCIALHAFGEAQFGVLSDEREGGAGFAWFDHPRARAAIVASRARADYVLVQVHAGLEMVALPLPELRDRYRELIDLGADLVIGHHPHVIQGSEEYKGKMIHYSLGNFYMDMFFGQDDPGSGAVLEVSIDEGNLSSRLIPLTVEPGLIAIDQDAAQLQAYHSVNALLLDEPAYLREIDRICEAFLRDVYSTYYEVALTGLGLVPNYVAFKRVARRIVGMLLGRHRETGHAELMLLHNIKIETHRWVVERALKNRVFS